MAAADREKVLTIVQAALPDKTPDQVNALIDVAQEYYLAATSRNTVPQKATNLWADLAVLISKGGLTASGSQTVSSIKRGDTTIEYNAASASGGNLPGIADRLAWFKVAKIR